MLHIWRVLGAIAVFGLACVVFGACDDEPDGDADADSDGDGDGDGDGDADTDSDGDGDGDGDGDADSGPLCTGEPTGDGDVHGVLVAWHPIEIRFEGPSASELDDAPNPFLDYRLVVTFTGPSGQQVVALGFFAGDGEGGSEGTVWSVRFSPEEGGEWTYEASFREGNEVALDTSPAAGTVTGFNGAAGWLCIDRRDPSASGFLGHGRLRYVGEHYLRLADGTYWIKGGADSPENFLGYAGFDNTVDQPGGASTEGLTDGVHSYAPHRDDWVAGDPDWGEGAGRGIIGALNYLGSEGANSIYFLPCNLGGDGRETYPYVSPDDLLHLDLSKLYQWGLVLEHAQRQGIALHFILSETEEGNENLHDNGQLGTERMLFYREMIARFGHHLAVFWNIGEENDYGADRQRQFAGYIRDLDPYDHPLTVHTHINRPGDQYASLVGDDRFDITSIQLSPDRAGEFTEEWRRESAEAGRPWVVMLDEIGPAGTGVTDTNAAEIRRVTLWPALLSGSGGVEWYFGYHSLPLGGDMRCEDFRTREAMWRFTRHALQFMHDHLPFWDMEPADELLSGESGGDGHVFTQTGEVYAVYLPNASSTGTLDLSSATGDFELVWFDPRTGTLDGSTAVSGGAAVALGAPPSSSGEDWVALIRRVGSTSNERPLAQAEATPTSGDAPLMVSFDGSGSTDTDGEIVSWSWSFGDGGTSDAVSPSYEYLGGGTFTARLTVTDDLGATGTDTVTIDVAGDPAGPVVSNVVLINATTDSDIGPLNDGDVLDLATLGTSELNVRAETTPTVVGSVRFGLDGDSSYRTENEAPYALEGDMSGDYNAWTPSAGSHSLSITAYDGPGATGTAGPTVTIGFTVP